MPKLVNSLPSLLAVVACSGCNSHAYYREAQQYVKVAQGVLISRGVCSNSDDCQKKHILFWEAGAVTLGSASWGGVGITLYETSDSALVDEITTQFRKLHSELKEPKVTLTVYRSKHLEPDRKLTETVFK
jgi:hypothetical protein